MFTSFKINQHEINNMKNTPPPTPGLPEKERKKETHLISR